MIVSDDNEQMKITKSQRRKGRGRVSKHNVVHP